MKKIMNCNNAKLDKQKEFLKKLILHGQDKEHFKVINLECGTGKSVTTQEVLSSLKDKKALYVVERNQDAIDICKNINAMAGKETSIAINTDTHNIYQFNKIKDTLKDYAVIIISHEKYKALAIDQKNREYFTEGRDILIIDEYLNMCKGAELSINKKFIDTFETLLNHRALRELWAECVQEIEEYLMSEKKLHSFFNSKKDYNVICKKINKLKNLVQKTLTKEYTQSIGYTKNELYKKIEELKQFYNQTCVVEGNIMYCTDRSYQYWLLNNNIILDATANITSAYKLNPIFKIYSQSKVLDHKDWLFYVVNANTNKSAKVKYKDFYEKLNQMVLKRGKDTTLLISNKNDESLIDATYKNHFGNITGSNEYKDLQNCIIAHNPNIPYRIYVLEYIYYSNKKFDNRWNWEGFNDGAGDNLVHRFRYKEFEKYRINKNATEIYQAIKRVNRGMSKESTIVLINNDTKIVDKVLKMFKCY